jgi:hypothetical protein
MTSNRSKNPMAMFYEGGRVGTKPVRIVVPRAPEHYAKGGLASMAKDVADAGVGGDELIVHINRGEYDRLKEEWGEPTINPHTGMPQFTPFWKQSWFAPVASIAGAALMATGLGAPIGAALLGGQLAGTAAIGTATYGSMLGNALIGGGLGALTGGTKGALTGGALAGIGTGIGGYLGSTAAGVSGSGTINPAGESTFSGWANGLSGNPASTTYVPGSEASVGASGPVIPPGSTTGTGIMSGNLGKGLTSSSFLIPAAMAALSAGGGSEAKPAELNRRPRDPNLTAPLDLTPLERDRTTAPIDYYNYGFNPEASFYAENSLRQGPPLTPPVTNAAMGGYMMGGGPLSQQSRAVGGAGTGRSDSISAQLSDGEYVMDAETVALLGDGSSKAGAKRLDQFRANIRKQKGSALAKGKFSPDAKRPEQYLMGGRA